MFFTSSPASRKAGQEALGRMYARADDRDATVAWAVREAQYDAVCAWGIPDHAKLQRLAAIVQPAFVANGDGDPMIPPRYSPTFRPASSGARRRILVLSLGF